MGMKERPEISVIMSDTNNHKHELYHAFYTNEKKIKGLCIWEKIIN